MIEGARLPVALILSGGLALGAYQVGALALLLASERIEVVAVAGSSMGAIHAAIIAGNPPERRIERLERFWQERATEIASAAWLDPLALTSDGGLRHARNWMNVGAARLAGVSGLYRQRLGAGVGAGEVPSLYEADELGRALPDLVDFDLLNAGGVRCVVATTDVETSENILFDTALGQPIDVDHLLASGGLLPNFPPVRIGERLLADGGFSANAPLEPLLATDAPQAPPPLCFLIELFAPDGAVPLTLETASGRSNDIQYAAQTLLRLQGLQRERAAAGAAGVDLIHLSYRPPAEEAGPEKQFDFSRQTLADRYRAGRDDALAALSRLDALTAAPAAELRVHRIRRADGDRSQG